MDTDQSPSFEPNPEGRTEEAWTVGRLLTWTADYLKRRGSESPRLDAEVMLAHVLQWPRVQLYTQFTDEVKADPRGRFRELVRRRAEGSPVAYLVGRKEFYSLAFEVSAGGADPAPRVRVRRRRVPHADQRGGITPGRGRRHGLRLSRRRLGLPTPRGAVRGDRHQRSRPWRSPVGMLPSMGSPTGSISDSAIASSRSPVKARST